MNKFIMARVILVSSLISLVQACSFDKHPKLIGILSLLGQQISNYTVGGTLTGLNGTIILQNNGGDNLSLTASGSFMFVTSLANTAVYSVTVLTQPSGQTCTASTNTGTISSANVTNVSVICSNTSYTVGGTVSGLTGAVVLQNNNGDNLSLTTNGSFSFATSVAIGASYSVTVLTQPAGLTCSASSNTGTISSANVTSVSVVCSGTSYIVGGTISGLTGTVVLQNNGGDNLSLTANAGFTFVTSVADGAAYSVTVLTQPSGQTCLTSSNTGTISSANITNVTVTCTSLSYTVGGTISGLTGTVVLQNNGGNNLSLTTNGSFTFTTSIVNGAAYSVTVFTQPGGQTCSASSNTGTISAANVTNVSVVCSGISYTVGGTIAGLVGTVVLQNNGGDNLSLSANGGFTFVTSVANGATYSVTAFSQPATRNCIITNPSGTISGANITNISITCTGNANGYLSSGTIINPLTLTGGVTTFTGSPCAANTACGTGSAGYTDSATPSLVEFKDAEGITTDGTNIYVADKNNYVIRKVVIATGATTTLAGNGTRTLLDGTGTAASFHDPKYIVTDGVNIYVGDSSNNSIRKINIATTVVTTIYTSASLISDPKGMVIYNNNLYIADNSGNAIRQINLSTNTLTTVVSTGISNPGGMALNGTDIYIVEKSSDKIYKTTIGTWTLTVFAGSSSGYVDGTGTAAKFNNAEGIISDGTNLYIADTSNDSIRKIVISTGVVTTLAGTNTAAYTNSSTSTNARFKNPKGIVSDGANVYVFDTGNRTIRLIQ